MGLDCFLCWFENATARDNVLIGGPWYVAGQIIGVDQWTIGSKPNSARSFSSPVWLRLPNLPLEYWDSDNLARLATGVWEPLLMEEQTNTWNRCAFARICVRIDLSKKLPKGVWAQGLKGAFFQPIKKEGIPLICMSCGKVGHKMEGCREIPPQSKNDMATRGPATQAPTGHLNHMEIEGGPDAASPSMADDPGEWTIVNRRRRPNKRNATNPNNNVTKPSSGSKVWQVVNRGNTSMEIQEPLLPTDRGNKAGTHILNKRLSVGDKDVRGKAPAGNEVTKVGGLMAHIATVMVQSSWRRCRAR
ncbi:uncharacterized protein LOC110096681 [Dendrobium catenatum]|uniref:uncharacterized protein LOC110096681 n=1 Tax=Dendrobium catenatum TaxID=906689 RepID=UPI0009F42346|nr:uncharacterized protein LOC110096681 [Dendrobium catenatum]